MKGTVLVLEKAEWTAGRSINTEVHLRNSGNQHTEIPEQESTYSPQKSDKDG
jgi:hypothetical protein